MISTLDEGPPKTQPYLGAKSTHSCTWRNLLACHALQASLVVGLTTRLIPALYLPAGIPQAQLATPAETSTGEFPAAGHLAPTPTVAQSTTAMKPTLQSPTPVNALAHFQSQVITNVDDFLSTLKPRTPVNVELLESYLEGHPDSPFCYFTLLGLTGGLPDWLFWSPDTLFLP